MNEEDPRAWLLFGILLIISSVLGLLWFPEGSPFRDIYLPHWGDWLLLFIGILISVLSVRGILLGHGGFTDEDVRRAKADLDRMYLKEHGSLPEEHHSKKDT